MLVLLYFAKYFLSWEEELFNFPENREKIVKTMTMTNQKNINRLVVQNRQLTNECMVHRQEFKKRDKTCSGLNQETIDSYRRLAELSTIMADKMTIVHENMGILAKIDPNW